MCDFVFVCGGIAGLGSLKPRRGRLKRSETPTIIPISPVTSSTSTTPATPTIIDGAELEKMLEGHRYFHENLPVGKEVRFAVLCERYDKTVHDRVLHHLKTFCTRPKTKLSASGSLDVEDLNRAEGGFQMVLKTDKGFGRTTKEAALKEFTARYAPDFVAPYAPGPAFPYKGATVPEFEAACQIRYFFVGPAAYGESFGTAKLVTFVAYENCPWRIMLELHRLFDAHGLTLGCGKCQIVSSEGMPDGGDAVWFTHSVWI